MTDKSTTRHQIVKAADLLFYHQGFEHTSFKHIANDVKISRGNFYYHFKTKDDILTAVMAQRNADTTAMLDRWELEGKTPKDRIRSFIHILITNKDDIKRYGCPVGTLRTELAKLDHASKGEATKLFALFQAWLRRQFEHLGFSENADMYALHLLARSQGVSTLANAFNDGHFINQEVKLMEEWLSHIIDAAIHTT